MFKYPKILSLLLLASCSLINEPVKITNSNCEINILQKFETDSIIVEYKKELLNGDIKKYFSEYVNKTLERLEKSKSNKYLLWPYNEVDSAKYFRYEDYIIENDMSKHDLINRRLLEVVRLCDKQIIAILNLMNNPNHFSYGECGTPIPEAEIKFYKNDSVIGTIEFACTHGQTSSEPFNHFDKYGGFNEKYSSLLDSIAPWK